MKANEISRFYLVLKAMNVEQKNKEIIKPYSTETHAQVL